MAIDREDDSDNENNEESKIIEGLEKKLKISRWILYGTGIFSAIIIAILATGMIVINQRLAQLKAPLPEAMDKKFAEMDKNIEAVSNFRRIELRRIDLYTEQLAALRQECNSEKTTPLIDMLVEREKDFQTLAKQMQSGTASLAGMVRGSRDWVDQHKQSLDLLIEQSQQRVKQLGRE